MLSRVCVRRASSVASRSAPSVSKQESTVANGLQVASEERHQPISHLVLAFRAGSRFELPSQKGLVHHVRNFVGRDTQQYLGVPLIWSTASVGGTLTAFSTREVFGVRISVPRSDTNIALSILGHVAAQPSFKPWELEEIKGTIEGDLAYRTAFDYVSDDVHKAAYRSGGLGNSLYSPASQIGKFKEAELRGFASQNLVSGKGLLFGVNVNHEELLNYGETHAPVDAGNGSAPQTSSFVGGQVRRESSDSLAHVILAGEGAPLSDAKGLATQSVLLAILGHKSVKYSGKSGNGVLSKVLTNEAAAVTGFQAPYSDSGLVGAYVVSEGASAGAAVRAVANSLKQLKVENLDRAKALATNNILLAAESGRDYASDRSVQLLGGQKACVVEAIKQVSAADVEAAARKLISRPAIASYGNIDHVPYVDEL